MNRLPVTGIRRMQYLVALDLDWCLRCHRLSGHRFWQRLFAVVSRLGDGLIWYTLAAGLLLVQGAAALPALKQMALTGVIGVLLYKWLKTRTAPPRPCIRCDLVNLTVLPLDEYSFPSGHTLHAVAFTVVLVAHYPLLLGILLPLTVLIGLSRLVLGLHYPSDVLAGTALGLMLSGMVLRYTA